MKQQQSGFTLVELVMVIVILGILAVTAIPTFINLTGDAQQAATDGVAGGLASGSAINYVSRSANVANGVPVANCTAVANTLQGGVPAGYVITAAAIAVNTTVTCTLTGLGATTSTFVGHGIL